MAKEAKAKPSRFENMQKLADLINKSQWGGENHDIAGVLGGTVVSNVERISTTCRDIDWAWGGGVPMGKIIELFGGESSGKSTLAYHIIASFQDNYPDKGILLLDTEHSYDPLYAEALGVKAQGIIHTEAESGTDALNIAKLAAESDCGVGLIIIDSIAALTTKSDDEGDIGDQTMAEQARMVSQAMRVLNSLITKHKITLLCTNQVREAVGQTYGDKTTTPAGKALRHYAHIRAKLARIGQIKVGDNVVGVKVKMSCVKNKVAPPFRNAEYTITFGIGIDAVIGSVEKAIALGVIVKKGGWFTFNGNTWQGQQTVVDAVRADAELRKLIDDAITAKANGEKPPEPEMTAEEKAEAVKDEEGDAAEVSIV